MANDIKLYDTVKDKKGNRFRVTEMRGENGHVIASLKGINGDGTTKRGMPRKVAVDELEKKYTRVNLPEVTVRKIDDLSEEEKPVVKEPTPSEKAAQIEKEAVRELSKKDIKEAVEASTFGGKVDTPETNALVDIEQYEKRVTTMMQMTYDLRKANEILKAEILDMKKTISKMKQSHEAEVLDLKDQLMEAEAAANAAKKYKDEVLAQKNQYSEALDDDSITFEEVLGLAETMQLMSTGTAKLAKQIIEKMEGRI